MDLAEGGDEGVGGGRAAGAMKLGGGVEVAEVLESRGGEGSLREFRCWVRCRARESGSSFFDQYCVIVLATSSCPVSYLIM